MRAAYGETVAAWSYRTDTFVVDLGEGARVEGEADVFGFTGGQVYASEAGQGFVGGDVCSRRDQVELGDFFAIARAGVLDVGLYGEAIASVQASSGEFEIVVREGGVAQAVAEFIEWLSFEVAVGAIGHGVVVEGRELIERGVEGDGEPTRGIVDAS